MPGLPREPRSRVSKIEVENFKSYRGQQEIGPFHAFTAIMGPNGSGKSNLMDAISFVLGVKGAQLRGSLKELLYSYTEPDRDEHRPDRGRVSLVMETEGSGTTTFTRSIHAARGSDSYSSVYSVDGENLSWSAYEAKLLSFGILVKARNFLVFQGDIEAVASKKPEELTKLFESISGSEAFKADHDRLEVESRDAETNFLFVQSRKKSTALDKRQKRQQKEEAEAHIKMQDELEALKSSHYLWQLFHTNKELQQAQHDRAEKRAVLEEAAKELRSVEGTMKEKRKQVASLNKQRILLEQKLKSRQAELGNKDPRNIKVGMEKERAVKRIKTLEREISVLREKEKDHKKKVQHLQKQLKALEAAEAERQARKGSQTEIVDEAILNKYIQLSEEARAKTSRDRGNLTSLQTLQAADERTCREYQESLHSIQSRQEQLQTAEQEAQQKKVEQEQELRQLRERLTGQRRDLARQEVQNRRNKASRLALEEKLRKLEEQLRESRASRKDREKEAQARETVGEMRRLFQGVYGRVSELARLTQQSYSLALAVVMGNNMDSVVVEHERAAKECVAYLKQKRIPAMTFIPLQTVKVRAPSERLRASLRGAASLALDLLEYDVKLEKAFFFVCGETLVCDSEAEAMRLALSDDCERHKAVTKSGLLIGKSGAMTGGGVAGFEARAARFDETHNLGLRQEQAKLEKELQALPSEKEGQEIYQKLLNEFKGLETKIDLLEKEMAAEGRPAGSRQEVKALEDKQAEMEPELEQLRVKVAQQQSKMEKIQARIHELEDRIYSPLSKEAGVPNIREFIEANKAAVEQQRQERIAHTKQLAKVRQQLEYELKAQKPEIAKLQAELDRLHERLAELQTEEEALRGDAAQAEREEAAMLEEIGKIKAKAAEAEQELQSLKREGASDTSKGSKLHRAVQDLDTQIDTLATKQADILHMAQLEQIALPKRQEEGPSDSEDAAAMETDESEKASAAVRMAVEALDFSKLSRQQKAAVSGEAREKLEEEFGREIQEKQAALAQAAPNLKAMQQYEEAKAKDDQEKQELEDARALRLQKVQEYTAIKQQRKDAFLAAFNHISKVIDPIYKDLTKSKELQLGGSGYLSLMGSDEECYQHGITFAVVPPGKRWRQMCDLSGGEKTLAALALLFAIHSFRPSPFFVLDEIDAALDASNVSRVANYIREKTRPKDREQEFQAVVISLKDSFFSRADALVGVTKEFSQGSSITFTLDLNQYGEPEQ